MADGGFSGCSESDGRLGIRHPHKMPTCLANTCIHFRCKQSDRNYPALAKRFFAQIESIRQDAIFAKEYRVQLHDSRFRKIVDALATSESALIGTGVTPSIKAAVIVVLPVRSIFALDRLKGPVRPSLMACREAKYLSTSI